MKAIIEVEKLSGDKYLILSKKYGNGQELLANNEIEIIQEKPMSEIKLTEEQFIEIHKMIYFSIEKREDNINRLVEARKRGWIVKDKIEQAIDALKDFYNRYYLSAGINEFHALKDYADTVIELLQERVKERNK